jgi:hypothetical protein
MLDNVPKYIDKSAHVFYGVTPYVENGEKFVLLFSRQLDGTWLYKGFTPVQHTTASEFARTHQRYECLSVGVDIDMNGNVLNPACVISWFKCAGECCTMKDFIPYHS